MTDRDDPDVNDAAESGPAARTTATGYRSVSYFLPAALHARLKAAWWGTREFSDGAPTLSALVERIFLEYVTRVELEHNAGAPFPPAPKGAQGPRGTASADHRLVAYYLPADLHVRIKATWWALRDASSPALSSVVESLFTAVPGLDSLSSCPAGLRGGRGTTDVDGPVRVRMSSGERHPGRCRPQGGDAEPFIQAVPGVLRLGCH